MDAKASEKLFASYLEKHSIKFERDFKVLGEKNVDFRIAQPTSIVLCDVKEVRDSEKDNVGKIDAYTHIREDLKDLRKKFGKNKPTHPVILVTMNFSSNFYTGNTIVRAMYGDTGAVFSNKGRSRVVHMPRGNASMTKTTNTTISGILVYDCANGNHAYFSNQYAKINLPTGYFPDVKLFNVKRSTSEEDLVKLSELMYWECDEKEKS